MDKTHEALSLALNALEQHYLEDAHSLQGKAITVLRERLAQPKQSYPDNFIDALKYDVARRDSEAQQPVVEHPPCQGMNCGITRTGQEHSLECQAEHAAAIAGGAFVKPAQQQEPVALPEKVYEFVPTPEPAKWHHPECEGQCIACLIEQVVQEAYGSQGLGYLQRHLTSPPASKPWVGLTDEEIEAIHQSTWMQSTATLNDFAQAIEAKLREKNA